MTCPDLKGLSHHGTVTLRPQRGIGPSYSSCSFFLPTQHPLSLLETAPDFTWGPPFSLHVLQCGHMTQASDESSLPLYHITVICWACDPSWASKSLGLQLGLFKETSLFPALLSDHLSFSGQNLYDNEANQGKGNQKTRRGQCLMRLFKHLDPG